MKTKSVILLFTCAVVFMLAMCTKPKVEQSEDEILFQIIKTTEGYTWYKSNDSLLVSTIPNAHNTYVRVRFNPTAQNALGSDGKLPVGTEFPDGSIIVKESYDANSNFTIYAVMYKRPWGNNTYEGWQWAEYDNNGKAVHSISKDNSGCIDCHNDNGNRDFVMFFERFP